ncbi:iron complex transport system permease protein [Lachnospiraceae bacterium XBB1006]|nr:iron complex transport system permease protein [Lachnospiraceae bacterium XBB1006]
MKRGLLSIGGLVLLLCLAVMAGIYLGSVRMSVLDVWNIVWHKGGADTAYHIVWDIRIPRVLAALLLGGGLSVSGFLLQTFFQNPIAGPYVLGISSGAKLTVALAMIVLLGRGLSISAFGMVVAAFVGAMLSMGFVLVLSFRVQNMSFLVVCGIMIGYICSAITDFLVTFAGDNNIVNLHNWSKGSFSGMSWETMPLMAGMIVLGVVFSFFLSKPISAYQLGETYARNMGVNIKGLRILLIVLSSLLSACVTAFAGPISFVGIAVPHLMKSLTKSARPLFLIPCCFLGGAVITILCDTVARLAFAPTELSISSVTAIFLVPVVITMMVKKQRGRL